MFSTDGDFVLNVRCFLGSEPSGPRDCLEKTCPGRLGLEGPEKSDIAWRRREVSESDAEGAVDGRVDLRVLRSLEGARVDDTAGLAGALGSCRRDAI